MSKTYLKLVPDKDVTNVILPEVLSFDTKSLLLAIDEDNFEQGDMFDIIWEDGNRLKFLRASLNSKGDKGFCFDINSSRDVIKREYERSSVILDVTGEGIEAQTLNISAGGMQLKTRQLMQENIIYDLKIKFESKDIVVKYEPLRVRMDKKTYFVSGKFVELDNEVKAFIIQQNLKNKIFGIKSSPIGHVGG